MDNCVVPIEIIDAICRADYGNWSVLIRTCKRVYRELIGRRWDAKCTLRTCTVRPLSSSLNEPYQVHEWRHGRVGRAYTVEYMGDYWQIHVILHYTDGKLNGESVYFKGSKTIYCYEDDYELCSYLEWRSADHRYVENHFEYELFSTKSRVMMFMDARGVDYHWIRYLSDES